MEDFNSYQVPALKYYLSTKGITTSMYRKAHLIRLCELAREIDLEDIETKDDYVNMDVRRRTVGDRMLPSISEVKLCDWNGDLKKVPDIDIADVFVYLINIGWDQNRLHSYKVDKGYLLYQNNHVDSVRMCPLDSDYSYVMCNTTPETRQSEDPYRTWLLVKTDGYIISGGCSCVADDGSCKHCTALSFALAAFCDRHKDRHTEVGTDVRCVWDKPRKESKPCRVKEICFSHRTVPLMPNKVDYQPCPTPTTEVNREVEKELYRMCHGTGALLLQTLDPPSNEDEDLHENPPDMIDAVTHTIQSGESLIDYLRNVFNSDIIQEVEQITCGQSENELWYKYRYGRITSSLFSKVCHFRGGSHDNYITREILNINSNALHTDAIKYGRQNEIVAKQLFFDMYSHYHVNAKMRPCGLNISQQHPFLGASPDAYLSCKCCGKGLIEVKCSYSRRNDTPYDVASDRHYHLYRDTNDVVKLRVDSPWYVQIQGQLGICNARWCDFVFYTDMGFISDRIHYDESFFNEIVNKCSTFFINYVHPALLAKI
ncbi:uncharacterized protein LOC133193101 [Saccostrea echinata]|uniref:uncharacterized protein LOC133193101 n=1 Tax=Saccostrea echinata TaxID=191078 RepID=UPI002A800449|nr:uncharacterized protein LOC133193101 [Saccostrea echinata]